MSIFRKSALAALAFFSTTGQANATIIYDFGAPMAGSLLETFEGLPLSTNSGTWALPAVNGQMTFNNSHIMQGTTGTYAMPYLDNTQYASVNSNGNSGSNITFSFNQSYNYFGILWGSVDTYNTLTFLDGNTVVGTIIGQTIISAANLSGGNQAGSGTVYANFNSSLLFNKIIASSTGIAFEFDNIRLAAVPLPAALPMFLAGIMGLGAMGRRRKQQTATA